MENNNIRMMIVDASPQSKVALVEILEKNGIKVVGEASSLDTAVEVYNKCNPDIVSIDSDISGSENLACCKAILLNDPKAQIILFSSVKDEETEAVARRIGVLGFVQKPIDEISIIGTINNILEPDTLFDKLQTFGIETFKEALSQNITSMTKSPVTFTGNECINAEFKAQEITSVIGIIGQYTGNLILGFSMDTANKIAKKLMHREPRNKDEVLTMVAEHASTIAGNSCLMLNKNENSYGLRVSPPSIFHGGVTQVVSPNILLNGCSAESELGTIHLWIGFKKGHVLWM